VFDLVLITPELPPGDIVTRSRAALANAPAGRVALQLRARHLNDAHRTDLARALWVLTREHGAPLILNEGIELARALGAEGVQLPERGPTPRHARTRLGPTAWIGASRHDLAGVLAAASDGADFVTLSPVFHVPDKAAPLGLSGLRAVALASALPIVALGGITADSAAEVIGAGAHGIAVIRDVLGREDPASAMSALLCAIDQGRCGRAPAAHHPPGAS
jgi:thiamine-phosphate pyrophosphorylase